MSNCNTPTSSPKQEDGGNRRLSSKKFADMAAVFGGAATTNVNTLITPTRGAAGRRSVAGSNFSVKPPDMDDNGDNNKSSSNVPSWKARRGSLNTAASFDNRDSADADPSLSPNASPMRPSWATPNLTPTKKNRIPPSRDKSGPLQSLQTNLVADVTISTNNVPANIQEKLKQRRLAGRRLLPPKRPPPKPKGGDDDEFAHLPEHVRVHRQRLKARQQAEDKKKYDAATKLQSIVLMFLKKRQYPKLLLANKERLERMKKQQLEKERKEKAKKARQELERKSSTKIQTMWRAYLPRKRFQRHLKKIRKKRQVVKRIQEIQKQLDGMDDSFQQELDTMKRHYAKQQKDMQKEIQRLQQQEQDEWEAIKKSGHDQIEFLHAENTRFRELKATLRKERLLLKQQRDFIKEQIQEIEQKKESLQQYVTKKEQSVQKKQISSQKLRTRYLPKYRNEKNARNGHCIAERRVKNLYKYTISELIIPHIQELDPDISSSCVDMLLDCETELQELPKMDIPEGLESFFENEDQYFKNKHKNRKNLLYYEYDSDDDDTDSDFSDY